MGGASWLALQHGLLLVMTNVILCHASSGVGPIIVIGSVNMDITVPVHRLPNKHETITARRTSTSLAVGGKGANQAGCMWLWFWLYVVMVLVI